MFVAGTVAAAAAALVANGLDVGSPASKTQPEPTTARVTGIIDGDTLRANTSNGRDLGRVRLLDAPEVAHVGEPAECYADKARRVLAALAPVGSPLILTGDPTQDDRDHYGRLLRYVRQRERGADVAVELLTAGAARPYPTVPAIERAPTYRAAAYAARRSGRGLWGSC